MIQQAPITRDTYHQHAALSRGRLFDLHDSPRIYEAKHILRTIPPKKPTPQMQLGTAIHAMALEGRSLLVSCPPEHLASNGAMSTKAAKEWRAEVEAEGYIVSDAETTGRIQMAAWSVAFALQKIGIDLDRCIIEQPILWTHAETEIACRCLPDIRANRGIIDLKTTEKIDDRDLERSIWDYGLWLQYAHYREGFESLGYPLETWSFLFVETQPPYRTKWVSLDADYEHWAVQKRHELMRELKDRTDRNDWAEKGEGEPREVKLPRFIKGE